MFNFRLKYLIYRTVPAVLIDRYMYWTRPYISFYLSRVICKMIHCTPLFPIVINKDFILKSPIIINWCVFNEFRYIFPFSTMLCFTVTKYINQNVNFFSWQSFLKPYVTEICLILQTSSTVQTSFKSTSELHRLSINVIANISFVVITAIWNSHVTVAKVHT